MEETMSDTVTISRDEYQRLTAAAETLSDLRAYDQVMADLANGDEELLPSEMVDRLLAGENAVRVWREHRGLGQTELAARAGIHRVLLANLESGRRGPSVDTLKKIAAALSVSIDDLI
jgi:mRNA interferase RelE/StbE